MYSECLHLNPGYSDARATETASLIVSAFCSVNVSSKQKTTKSLLCEVALTGSLQLAPFEKFGR